MSELLFLKASASTCQDSFGEIENLFFLTARSRKKSPPFLCCVQGREIDPVSFDSRCVFGWIKGCECVLQDGRAAVFTVRISEDWTHTHTHTHALLCPEREKDGRVNAGTGVPLLVRTPSLLFIVLRLALALTCPHCWTHSLVLQDKRTDAVLVFLCVPN